MNSLPENYTNTLFFWKGQINAHCQFHLEKVNPIISNNTSINCPRTKPNNFKLYMSIITFCFKCYLILRAVQ